MHHMGTLPKKQKTISPGESSQWGVRDVAQKRQPLHDDAYRMLLDKKVYLKGAGYGNYVQGIHAWHP
jgi:hypothetical protein